MFKKKRNVKISPSKSLPLAKRWGGRGREMFNKRHNVKIPPLKGVRGM